MYDYHITAIRQIICEYTFGFFLHACNKPILPGRLIDWGLMALSAQYGYIVP